MFDALTQQLTAEQARMGGEATQALQGLQYTPWDESGMREMFDPSGASSGYVRSSNGSLLPVTIGADGSMTFSDAYQDPTMSGERDKMDVSYTFDPKTGTAVPTDAAHRYQQGRWTGGLRDFTKGVALASGAGYGANALLGGGAAAGSGADWALTPGLENMGSMSSMQGFTPAAGEGWAVGGASGLTDAQAAYGGLEAGGAAAGMGGNFTAAGTFGTAAAGAGSWIPGLSNNSLMQLGGGLASSYLQDQSARKAIDAQTNASNQANALAKSQHDQARADNMPWMQAGQSALAKLTGLLNDGSLTSRFAGKGVENEPGYAFGMREGMKAIDNSASARGGIGGAALKAGTKFAQDYAGMKYNEAFNRWNTENNGIYNRLSGVAGTGQTANSLVGQLGNSYVNNTGQNMIVQGNRLADYRLGQGNIYGNALNQGIAIGNHNNWWQG